SAPGIRTAAWSPANASAAAWATASSVAVIDTGSASRLAIWEKPASTRAWRSRCSKLSALRSASDAIVAKLPSASRWASVKTRSRSTAPTPRTPCVSPSHSIGAAIADANPRYALGGRGGRAERVVLARANGPPFSQRQPGEPAVGRELEADDRGVEAVNGRAAE